MKTKFSLICLLILLCSIATCVNLNGQDLQVRHRESKDSNPFTIKGMDRISDPEFKKMLSQFLFLDEKNDYKQLYNFFSKEYINNLPNIKTANEYAIFMEDSERSEIKYLEISRIQHQNSQYNIDIIYSAMAEGEIIKIKTTYFFIKEDTGWKYNGRDIENYQELK